MTLALKFLWAKRFFYNMDSGEESLLYLVLKYWGFFLASGSVQSNLRLTYLRLRINLRLRIFYVLTKFLLHKTTHFNNIFSGRISD